MSSAESTERRNATRQQIEHMLAERQQLLGLLIQASNLKGDNLELQDKELLEEFCQVLTDYVAAGHFGLYERIAEGRERRQEVANISRNIYPRIEESTQQALEFSEKYSTRENSNNTNLANDLSRLGELLVARIELEDQLISKILAGGSED
jgi:regulator of sigma D